MLSARTLRPYWRSQGLRRPEQTPAIIGRPFHEACNGLASIHFPEDKEVNGYGPRGLLWGMHGVFNDKGHDLPGALAIAEVLKRIIRYRPPLDLEESGAEHPKGVRPELGVSPFYDRKRNYGPQVRSVFVLMPFREPWSDRIWSQHLRPYLQVTPSGKKLSVHGPTTCTARP